MKALILVSGAALAVNARKDNTMTRTPTDLSTDAGLEGMEALHEKIERILFDELAELEADCLSERDDPVWPRSWDDGGQVKSQGIVARSAHNV
jgi:hypothetical protein